MPPKPEPGMVLSYSYLWNREHIKGGTEGRKDRPSVVVLVINRTPGDVAYVLPTSTSNPKDGGRWTIEIPRSIKSRLKLDERRSWINVTEFNIFAWTGIICARPSSFRARRSPSRRHAYTATCRMRFLKRLRH